LIAKYGERATPLGNTLLISGLGENLPIRDSAADLAICINVIDHVISAEGVLQELRRILKKSGDLVLEAHTFPALLTPLMLLDTPHTYHWSVARLVDLVERSKFKIRKIENLDFNVNLSWKSLFLPRDWKYIFGSMFMKLTYIHASKMP
jgi:ubiquinone/menaquinone biosynthesis C-methylase UbiE